MFRKKKAKETLQTGGNVPPTTATVPVPAMRQEYESYQEGKHLVVQFICGESLRLVTEYDAQINFRDEVNVLKGADGATHRIVTSQIQHVQERRAVRCGKCGKIMLPDYPYFCSDSYVVQSAAECTECRAHIRVMDDDT